MSNPSGPDRDATSNPLGSDHDAATTEHVEEASTDNVDQPVNQPADQPADQPAPPDQSTTESGPATTPTTDQPVPEPEYAVTETHAVIADDTQTDAITVDSEADSDAGTQPPAGRQFTAPGFDARPTQVIGAAVDPATEILSAPDPAEPPMPPRTATPQSIPPRGEAPSPPGQQRNWGWVVAVTLVIAALVALAVLGTVLLTRESLPKVSQEDQVRATIENFDIAVQNGDLATLRSITCGTKRDAYVKYDGHAWAETHRRVAAAKQYPVIASIDQVVVNGEHAEANVTTFMAYAPRIRSTRSFDLQFRDDQWKICQAPNG